MTAPVTRGLRRLGRVCLRAVETAAFWLAIVLPAVYGPLLVAASVSSGVDPAPAFYLLAAHAVVVAVGQRHAAD